MSEPTMPSERVSRERREAVIRAIQDVLDDSMQVLPYGDDLLDGLTDAATAAILPDREAFYLAVETCIEAGINYGAHDSMTKARTIAASKAALIALVYGDDDASGGTR